MTTHPLKYAMIVPLRRVPPQFELLTYSYNSTQKLQIGDIVSMPFGKSSIFGMVYKLNVQRPSFSTKPIEALQNYRLPSATLELLETMRNRYSVGFSKILQLCVTDALITRLNKKIDQDAPNVKFQKKAHKNRPARLPAQHLYIEKNQIDRGALIAKLTKKIHGKTLIIVPEQYTLRKLSEQLTTAGVAFDSYHGETTPRQRALIWEAVRTNENPNQIILATRIGLFLPFPTLDHVVLLDEDSDSYEEQHAPNYSGVEVAHMITKIQSAQLSIIGPVPLFETWLTAQQPSPHNTTFTLTDEKHPRPVIEIISMVEEARRQSRGPLSEAALERISQTLIEQKQVLIFVTRRGVFGMIVCVECGAVPICPHCGTVLSVHKNNMLECHRCTYTAVVPPQCGICGSVRQKSIGFGTAGVEDILNKIFARAKVVRLDKDSVSSRKIAKLALSDEELNKADIIVATKMIDKPLVLPRLATSIALSPDGLLHIPTFRAQEKALQTLSRLVINTTERVLIQTYLPNALVYESLVAGDIRAFFENELHSRKLLKLPPFTN